MGWYWYVVQWQSNGNDNEHCPVVSGICVHSLFMSRNNEVRTLVHLAGCALYKSQDKIMGLPTNPTHVLPHGVVQESSFNTIRGQQQLTRTVAMPGPHGAPFLVWVLLNGAWHT